MPDKLVKSNAKLGFKVGTQSAVDAILTAGAGAVHGSFYLAADTHRLYIGNEDTSLSPVNEGIITVAHLSDMPDPSRANAGQFYYITGESDPIKNVLTVSNGSQWIHINQNTNTFITDHNFTSVDISGGVQVEDNIRSSDNSTKTGRFHVKGSNGVSVSQTTTTITVDGNNVTVPVLTVTGDTYTLSSAAVSGQTNQVDIKLDSTNTTNDSKVTLAAAADTKGNTNIGITENDGVISISSRDTRNDQVSVTNGATSGFSVNIKDNYNQTKSGTFDPAIQIGDNTPAIKFVNGVATLDVYSQDEIDDIMTGLNAMTYRGTLGDGGTAATSLNGTTWYPQNASGTVEVHVGDTFLTTSTINYNGTSVPAGSLLIARGTEDSTGKITSDLVYDVVKATKDTDTTYSFLATNSGLVLRSSTGNTTGELAITNGNAIEVTFTPSAAGSGTNTVSNGKQTVTVTHANVDRNDPATATQTGNKATNTTAGQTVVSVVTGVTTNDQGHVTAVATKDYTLYDTNSKITGNTTTTSNYVNTTTNKNVGVIENTLVTTFGDNSHAESSSFRAISSESLTITTDNTNTKSLTNADTVNGLNIEMVWGSF